MYIGYIVNVLNAFSIVKRYPEVFYVVGEEGDAAQTAAEAERHGDIAVPLRRIRDRNPSRVL